jgi:hypothetical protein
VGLEDPIGETDGETLKNSVAMGTALGRAGAHEAGHYLLWMRGHSSEGIMRSGFTKNQWHEPDRNGAYSFTAAQASSLLLDCIVRRTLELGFHPTFDPQILWGSPIPWDQRAMNDFLNSLDSIETGWNDPPPEVVPVD